MEPDIRFWLVVFGAIVVKLVFSVSLTIMQALATIVASVFCAIVFTGPLMAWLGFDASTYRDAVAALLALSGEQLVRRFLAYTRKPESLMKDVKKWRS